MNHREHGVEELCAAGEKLYERALRDGHLPAAEAAEAPCLTGLGLLHPAVDDLARLEPVAPAAVLNRFLRTSRARITEERRREDRLLQLFPEQFWFDAALVIGTLTSLGAIAMLLISFRARKSN